MFNKSKKLNIYKTFSYISLLCVLNLSSCYESKEEGSSCERRGLVGICTRVSKCEVALYALGRGELHQLLRCGFEENEEVVCCPDLADRNKRIETTTVDDSIIWTGGKTDDTTLISNTVGPMKRKCELMCEKIYRENNIKPSFGVYVINGVDAKLGQFPHMAALGLQDDDGNINWQKCAGALIAPRFVLTAAHCVFCVGCSDPVKVRFGVVNIKDDKSAQDVDVDAVLQFDGYDPDSRHNDIALIKLKADVRMSENVYPACLYTEADDPEQLRITGWGQTEAGNSKSLSNTLQFALLEAVPVDQCNSTIFSRNNFTAKTIVKTQICATSKSDTCQGDSGGPLQRLKTKGGYDIVGVVSYGIQCGTTIPGVYTRVYSYLDWIEQQIWPN